MSDLVRDLRYGLRTMRRSPGFMAVAILTLALGIGATTVILSVARGVLFRPLPFKDVDRLVLVWDRQPPGTDTPASYSEFLEWREHVTPLESVAAWFSTSFTLTGEGEAEEIWGERASAAILPMLGIEPILGRSFRPEEDRRDSDPVAIISHAFWKRRYAADPGVCGRTMNLNGKVFTIVGVLPPRVAGILPQDSLLGRHRDIWIPLRLDAEVAPADVHFLRVIGRLRPRVTVDTALQEAQAAVARLVRPPGADHGV